MKHLFIAGHGELKNGGFDTGAIGYINMGEHIYFENILFPKLKKYLGDDVIFFSEYNVYSYGNLESLVKKYGGKDEVMVTEWHFDATSNDTASGGHVIVHKDFAPDKLDLAYRNAIKNMVGVVYNHKGERGISGRDDLANANIARDKGINYRLLELGFCTNKKDADVMLNKAESYAYELAKAILGKTPTEKKSQNKTIETPTTNKQLAYGSYTDYKLAEMAMQGELGNGAERRKALGVRYNEVQRIINNKLNVQNKTIKQLVNDTLKGYYGNGETRKWYLGSKYNQVQKEINKL